MACKSVKQWFGVALLLPALLHGDSLRDGPGKEWAEPSAGPRMVQPGNFPEEEPFPAWLLSITEKIAFEHGLSPRLVKSIILTESKGDPRKVSPKGAKGLMQLMPVVMQHYQVKDPFEPVANIQAGVQYLRSLLEVFSGDLALALAAYNAGPTAVRKYRGIPPFPETEAFVLKVNELFHAAETRPSFPLFAPRTGEEETQEKFPARISLRGSPQSLALFWRKIQGGPREVERQ